MDAETKVESVPANEDSAREKSSKGSIQLMEGYVVKEVVEDDSQVDQTEIPPESDLSLTERRIWVVTTASLPWRTGTFVNPLARALCLTRGRPKDYVTLLIPWLPKQADQLKIFGDECTFDKEEDQEKWVRQYCKEQAHCESK
jgi:digalactosyldiacylglycerol synthase